MLKLIAQKRDIFGKALEKARQAGQLPVVVYGGKKETASYFVDLKEFNKAHREAGESSIVTLSVDGKDESTLIHDVAFDPISGSAVHADFLVVDVNKPIQVAIPVEFVGVAPAVKELSAVLVKVLHEIEVEALPKDLPHEITVDVSSLLNLESKITVGDLKAPAGVTFITEAEEVVAAVGAAQEEIVEEAPVDLSAIEVEEKGKKEEEGAEEAK